MARKPYQLLLGLCALLSIATVASTAPAMGLRQLTVVHGKIGPIRAHSASRHHLSRRIVGRRLAASLDPGAAQWTVRAGDTGNKIAAQLGIQFFQLAFLNPTVRWRFLQIGQTLNIPADGNSSHVYVVVAGDTGKSIAAANGITFFQLDTFNRNIDWYTLRIGQSVVVPSSSINATRLSQLPNIEQADQDADVPASSLEIPVAPVVIDNDPALTTSSKGVSPFLTPGETPSPSRRFSPRALRARDTLSMRSAGLQDSTGLSTDTMYTIKTGDTGYNIATQLEVSFDVLDKANPGINWAYLQVGQAVNVPTGTHVSASITASPASRLSNRAIENYVTYSGTTSTAQPPYPSMSTWIPFAQLWTMNSGNIGTTCVFESGTVPANTESETASLRSSILSVSSDTNVHPSFILAVILQESNGCVRVPTTSSWEGVQNPGLMQSFKGRASCNSRARMLQPCPEFMIKAMIVEGVKGNQNVGMVSALRIAAKQDGLRWSSTSSAATYANINMTENTQVQGSNTNMQYSGNDGVSTSMGAPSIKQIDEAIPYYQAARIYNSGSLPADGDLSSPTGSTRCYVSDVANRLLGWTGGSGSCSLG